MTTTPSPTGVAPFDFTPAVRDFQDGTRFSSLYEFARWCFDRGFDEGRAALGAAYQAGLSAGTAALREPAEHVTATVPVAESPSPAKRGETEPCVVWQHLPCLHADGGRDCTMRCHRRDLPRGAK